MPEESILYLLGELKQLLTTYRVPFWTEHLSDLEARYRRAISSGKDWAIRDTLPYLEELYGGMGSFNDITINSMDSKISEEEEPEANERLDDLRSALYKELKKAKSRGKA